MLRWAALLHDIGKPDTFTLDESGVGHFYGHAAKSAQLAGDILRRLKFDNASRERILLLVKNHGSRFEDGERGARRALARFGPEALLQLIELARADNLGKPASLSHRLAALDGFEAGVREAIARESCFSLRDLAVRGGDLLALGLSGRAVGEALEKLLEAVIDGRVPNEREALLEYLRGKH